jgi:hypothetical protein
VRGDFLPHGLTEAVPQVPAVAGLDRAGQYPADGLAVGTRPVTAHDLNSWVAPQPLLRHISGATGDDAGAAAGLGVDEDGCADAAAAQREVAGPQHPGHRQYGQRDLEQDTQHGVAGAADAQRRQQARRGPAR